MMQDRPLVSIAEAARALGVSPQTLRRLISERRIPAYRVRGQWRLDLERVRECLEYAVIPPSERRRES